MHGRREICTRVARRLRGGTRRSRWGNVANTHKRPSRAGIELALIDDIEDRGTQNKRLRNSYLEVEQQVLAAATAGTEADLARLQRDLSRIGDTFVRYNLGLAGVLVNKYSEATAGEDETKAYMLACMEALWLAFITWDPEKSTFGTWSRKAIEGALWREVHFTKRPHRKYYEELQFRAAVNHAAGLKIVLGREPTDDEIAKAVGISVVQLQEVRRPKPLSLDKPAGEDGEQTLLDVLTSGDDGNDQWDDDSTGGLALLNAMASNVSEDDVWLRALAAATAELDDLSVYLLFVRTGLHGWNPENLPEIAAATGIGREIVRRKTHKALETVTNAGKNLPALLS